MKKFMLRAIILIHLLYLSCATGRENFTEKNWSDKADSVKSADLYLQHSRDGKFFNPWMPMIEKSIWELILWKLSDKNRYTIEEKNFMPAIITDAFVRIKSIHDKDFILWVGHNTFLIRINGEYWLTDPVFSERVAVLKRKTPPGISMDELKKLSGRINVLISHNHYDHLNEESIEKLPDDSAFYVPLGLKRLITGLGKKNVTEMDWWQEIQLGEGKKLYCLPVQHWSRRIGQSFNSTLWAGFLLVTPSVTIYFGGDSGYFAGYREIGKKFHDIDYALIPTTAYHPRWFMHYAHINIDEAIRAFLELKAKYFIPTQWGTFELGDEPVGYAALDLVKKIRSSGLDKSKFLIMGIGEIIDLKRKTNN